MGQELAGKTVLVVEDDADNAELLSLNIEMAGATVRSVLSARAALDLLRSWQPDVLLIDLSLPVMDGFALLEAIRAEESLRGIPAVAVTAYTFERDVRRCLDAGFAAHVAKPCEMENLIHVITTLVPDRASVPASGIAPRGSDPAAEGLWRRRTTTGR
jgi:CheY-like chemotaxis protein